MLQGDGHCIGKDDFDNCFAPVKQRPVPFLANTRGVCALRSLALAQSRSWVRYDYD